MVSNFFFCWAVTNGEFLHPIHDTLVNTNRKPFYRQQMFQLKAWPHQFCLFSVGEGDDCTRHLWPQVSLHNGSTQLQPTTPLDHLFIYLFIYWRLIALSTAQGHLRAFHKFKSYTCRINKAFNISKTIHKNKQKTCFTSKNSTFSIALVYNSDTVGTCWYRWPLSNLSIPVYKNHPQTSSGNQKRYMPNA